MHETEKVWTKPMLVILANAAESAAGTVLGGIEGGNTGANVNYYTNPSGVA